MQESAGGDAAAAGRFYDRLRASGQSSSALAYGDTYIGQECTLTADEINILGAGQATFSPPLLGSQSFSARL
jgi:hypothetical protein